MRIDSTVIRGFRNFSGPGLTAKWDPGINLILGRNGTGKTNLLEALSILTGWGAFTKTSAVVSWQSQNRRAYLGAEFSGEESLGVSAEISSRISLRLNGKSASFTDLRMFVPSIIFLTGNLSLIDGSPSSRRLFIDRLCALFVPPFAKRLADFRNVIRARSSLLRQGKSPSSTDAVFSRLGGWIMDIRRSVLAELVKMTVPGKVSLEFIPGVKSGEEYLRDMAMKNAQREIYAQRVLYGPSYDDIAITMSGNGRAASESLSRGQKRRLILHMIITAGRLIDGRLKRNPILLLDDLTAELDADGRKSAYDELNQTGWQIFITAPEKPFPSRKKFGGLTLS